MSTETDRRLVLDTETAELRRRLGPTAWVVFEELLLASTGPNETCHASVSIRTLAAQLGLAKDTVARALIRLRGTGLVSNCQWRSKAGTFSTGNYQLTVPSSIVFEDHSRVTSPTTRRPSSRSRLLGSTGSQLALAIDS
jgi:hypothetical protein